jgi:4-hydroxy-3-polyprenylbenzoate decarboxylase
MMLMNETAARRRIAVGVTGASGAIYAVRTIAALLEAGCDLEIVFSDYGKRLLLDELGPDAKADRLAEILAARYGDGVLRGSFVVHSNKDLGATLASGSHRCDAMVIVPCSMKTLAGIRTGYAEGLVCRAADVVLKERRKLVLVPRETPLSEIHLENMLDLARKGVQIVPPMPAFYNHPKSVNDIVDHLVVRILDQFDLPAADARRWDGMRAAREIHTVA